MQQRRSNPSSLTGVHEIELKPKSEHFEAADDLENPPVAPVDPFAADQIRQSMSASEFES